MIVQEFYDILPSYQRWHIFRLLRIVKNKLPHELIYELLDIYFYTTVRPYIFSMNDTYMCQDKFLPFIKYKYNDFEIFAHKMYDKAAEKSQLNILKYISPYIGLYAFRNSINNHCFHVSDWMIDNVSSNISLGGLTYGLRIIWYYDFKYDYETVNYFKTRRDKLIQIMKISGKTFKSDMNEWYKYKLDTYKKRYRRPPFGPPFP